MKKTLLAVLFISASLSIFGQRYRDDWTISVGVNALNNIATQSPINSPGEWGFRNPLSAAIEYSWIDNFAIEQSFSINGFDGDPKIDNSLTESKYNYFALDANAKYYFRELIFGRGRHLSWFDIHANAGLGYFHIEKSKMSFNLGGGVLVWLDRNQTFGLRAQTIAKFSFNNSVYGYDNNHYQYHLQAVFRL